MKILYLHGLGARPGGIKPTYLAARGHVVINPWLPDDDFAASVAAAQAALVAERPEVVVGSSRGGAVAIAIDTQDVPVVLIAPAWRRWGTPTTARPRTIIIHSPNDTVVPIADSRTLVAASSLPPTALVIAGRDHYMVDDEAFGALEQALETLSARE